MIPCDSLAPDPLAGASARSQLEPYFPVLVKNDLRLGKARLRIEKLKCRLKNHLSANAVSFTARIVLTPDGRSP